MRADRGRMLSVTDSVISTVVSWMDHRHYTVYTSCCSISASTEGAEGEPEVLVGHRWSPGTVWLAVMCVCVCVCVCVCCIVCVCVCVCVCV